MIFLIDNYILPIEEFKLNDDKIEIWNTEFTDKSEISLIKNKIIEELTQNKTVINLSEFNIGSFRKFVKKNEVSFI